MDIDEILKQLKSFRRKWKREQARERKLQRGLNEHAHLTREKSVGFEVAFGVCVGEVDRLIRRIEQFRTLSP